MATYEQLRDRYRKRQRDALVDTLSVGLSCADELMVDLGLLEGIGDSVDALNSVFGAIPFLLIVAGEGSQVVLGKKACTAAVKSAAFRAVKSGAAIAVGTGAAMALSGAAAMPAAIAVHLLFGRYKSRTMLSRRLENRIDSVRFLQTKWCPDQAQAQRRPLGEAEPSPHPR